MGTLKKIRSNFNSLKEVLLFLQVFLLITFLPLLIRLLTMHRLMTILTPDSISSIPLDSEELKNKIVKYTDYILSRNFWIYRSTCLKRSLTLYHFLRKLGMDVQICFGVRYNEKSPDMEIRKRLEGHAWLLNKGEIFLEKRPEETRTYKVTYSFPGEKLHERQKEFA